MRYAPPWKKHDRPIWTKFGEKLVNRLNSLSNSSGCVAVLQAALRCLGYLTPQGSAAGRTRAAPFPQAH